MMGDRELIKHGLAEPHIQRGQACLNQGELDQAIAHFQAVIELNPNCCEAHNALGECLVKQGNLTKAMLCFRRAIALNSNSAWYYQNLGNAVSMAGFLLRANSFYHQALALDQEAVQRWKQNFEYSIAHPDDTLVQRPIFILGCGHSGTSLILVMLGSHSSIFPIDYESGLFVKPEEQIQSILKEWDSECLASGKNRWIEKTPSHIFYLYKIWKYRPQSQVILMLRDGRDVVCSLKQRVDYNNFEKRIDRWIYDNMAAFAYWQDPRLKVVKYEDIIAQPEATMGEILTFLGEPYTADVLQFHQTKKHWYSAEITKPEEIKTLGEHNNLRNWQINQPLFDGRGRWKQEMTAEEKVLFKAKAQKYLEKFGYVEDDNW